MIKMDLERLSEYFHMPINDVSKELGICTTVLKKICRNLGIPRWPHRKVRNVSWISSVSSFSDAPLDKEHRQEDSGNRSYHSKES
jgi:hypothetical protein